ncbi:MAG: DoxX family membrane protein [Candidatus Latescibacteria bacterium]|nr:DoxX family membrane protein [Candidatus Latescibacterota bacterium]
MSMLVVLRIAIGWHFLYEGISKLYTPGWTSQGYLSVSKWIFSGVFQWIAAHPVVLKIVDMLNIWGLILIGLGLMLGCFSRFASISGIVLLLLYYIANPPFIGMDFGVLTEGNYLIVDKNFVELLSLIVLTFFPTGTFLGIDRLMLHLKRKSPEVERTVTEEKEIVTAKFIDRRELLKSLATVPFFGVFVFFVLKKMGWESYEEKNLKTRTDAVTSATIKTFDFSSLKDLKGTMPHAKIRDLELSRVILGGNLIGGWAHARDLIYVSKLVKAYHHKTKIFETFLLAEKCGINAFLTNPVLCSVINEYWKRNIGKIKFISDCGGQNLIEGVKKSIDNGASACYVHGGIADNLVQEGKVEEIGKALEFIKQNGLPAGIGGHALETIKACVSFGLEPDFWMKTMHKIDYWSAGPTEQNDNIWCTEPVETAEFMRNLKQPWIGFKTLAAGAIQPTDGFRYAFENGADFICVGMYDFQIVDDVNIALDVLNGSLNRQRPWFA